MTIINGTANYGQVAATTGLRPLPGNLNAMKQERTKPEIPGTPHKPEIEPIQPETPAEAPQPEITPDKDPVPSKSPMEVPPGRKNE